MTDTGATQTPTGAAYVTSEIPSEYKSEYAGTYIERLPSEMQKPEIDAIEKAVKSQSTFDKAYVMEYRRHVLEDLRGYGDTYSETVEDRTQRTFDQYIEANCGKLPSGEVVPKSVVDKFVAEGLDREKVIQAINMTGREIEI